MEVEVGRIYDDPGADDDARALVDRLWPCGITKKRAAVDRWARNIAPSGALRNWYGHRPERFSEFVRPLPERAGSGRGDGRARGVEDAAKRKPLTLLTATRDVERSGAAVLAELLRREE